MFSKLSKKTETGLSGVTEWKNDRYSPANKDKSPYASKFTIASFIIEALIIILSVMNIFGLSINNDFLSLDDRSFGVFSILTKPFESSGVNSFSYWFSFVFFSAVIAGLSLANGIYFVHKLCLYTFYPDKNQKIRFGFDYSIYSAALPMAMSIVSAYTVLCYNSWLPECTVYPSPVLCIIFALTLVQVIVNSRYKRICA